MHRGQQPQEIILRPVGVLVFVDQDEAVPVAVVFLQLWLFHQQGNRLQEQVVEIQRVGIMQPRVVMAVETLQIVRRLRRKPGGKLLRRYAMIFGVADPAKDFARGQVQFGIAVLFENPLDQSLLVVRVVNGKVALVSEMMDLAAQQAHAKRVKCGNQRFSAARGSDNFLNALPHLFGCLIGKRDG